MCGLLHQTDIANSFFWKDWKYGLSLHFLLRIDSSSHAESAVFCQVRVGTVAQFLGLCLIFFGSLLQPLLVFSIPSVAPCQFIADFYCTDQSSSSLLASLPETDQCLPSMAFFRSDAPLLAYCHLWMTCSCPSCQQYRHGLTTIKGMGVDQEVNSMDVNNPPLNSNDEGEQCLLIPGEIINGKRQVHYMWMWAALTASSTSTH